MSHTRFSARFGRWVVHHRLITLLLSLGTMLVVASGARFLDFTTNYRVFFSEDNPQLQAFDELEHTYTKLDNVLIVVTPADGNVFTRANLAALSDLTAQAWQVPYSTRVDSLTNFQHSYAEGDELIVRDLVTDPESLSDTTLADIRRIALQEPLLVNRIISADGSTTGINITVYMPDETRAQAMPEIVTFVRGMLEDFSAAHPGMTTHLTGMVMMDNAFSEASQADMQTLVPASFTVILLSLALLLRGWTGTFVTFWLIIMAVASAMGLAGWLGYTITPPSASAPTIILTLAVANAVHIMVSFRQALKKMPAKQAAMAESLRLNLQPIFLTCFTTVVGFMSMNFSDVPPFQDLGNIVAMGVGFAFLYSVTFVPALAALLPAPIAPAPAGQGGGMARFGAWVVARRRTLVWTMAAAIVALTALIPRNELNDLYMQYFDESIPFRAASDYMEQHLSGLYRIDFSLDSGESGGISKPAFLQEVGDFTDWLRTQPEVTHVLTLSDVLKRLNKNLHGDDPAWFRLPADRELAAQYLLLYEMSLPYGLDLNDQINVDKSAMRVSINIKTLSVKDTLAFENRARDWLRAHAPHITPVEGTGPTMMFAHIGLRNIVGMLLGTTVALAFISLVLVIALRSVPIGLVSLVPNLVPAAMAFGLWGLFVGQVGLGLSVVMGVTLGIVVDDTVHFLSKYLRARRERGLTPEDAVRYAFNNVGQALWVTSVVLVAGFLVLALSNFKMNSDMGLLTAITIALALAADFLFLPPLLMKLEEKLNAQKTTAQSGPAGLAAKQPARADG
ncbi:MAG TPA: RND family transporter [Gammaproteobacteria bacterium]|nr:RND family transporter [Gammaproteobacteria bacterium]